jgi:hypothetical protein
MHMLSNKKNTYKARLEFQINRGVIDIESCDEQLILTVNKCIDLCKNNKNDEAISILKPLLYFEWNWSNGDGDPSYLFLNFNDINMNFNDNWKLKIGIDENNLIITANVYFDVQLKNKPTAEAITDWLNDNSEYSCGFISCGWGYTGSDGDNVNLIKIFK